MNEVAQEACPAEGVVPRQNESIKVIVRVRPLGPFDAADPSTHSVIDVLNKDTLIINEEKRTFTCSFDSVLSPTSTQVDVYNTLKNCTACVLDGFNSTVFAYGQTGSGKTHSMYGPPMTDAARYNNPLYIGLIPRSISDIFGLIENRAPVSVGGGGAVDAQGNAVLSSTVYCSFVQIYNENLFDMLRDSKMTDPLSIREEKKEIYVQGLSEYCVKSVDDCMELLRIAEENRAIRETYMNQFSSRSHSIFQIFLEQKLVAPDGQEVARKSKFNLVDLAGSEKWNIKHNNVMQDNHILEMTNINLSLHTLGRCISALALRSNGRDAHIPYRDSKLTRLLQDSLGGNAKTYLIATISPARTNVEESISTLKFADRAKQVMIQAVINDARPIDQEYVDRLKRDNEHLRYLLKQYMPIDAYEAYLKEAEGGEGAGAGVGKQPGQSRGGTGSKGDSNGVDVDENESYEQVEAHDVTGQAHHIGYVHPISSSHPLVQQQYNTTDPVERQAIEVKILQVAVNELQQKNSALQEEVKFYRMEVSKYTGDATVSSTIYQQQHSVNQKQQSQKQSENHSTPTKGTGAKVNFSMKGIPKNGSPSSPIKVACGANATAGSHAGLREDESSLQHSASGDNLVLTAEDARLAMAAVNSVMTQNTQVWSHLDELYKISQSFFSFGIDEDEYKQRLGVLYDQLQRIRREVTSAAGSDETVKGNKSAGIRGGGAATRGKDPIYSLLPANIVNMLAPVEEKSGIKASGGSNANAKKSPVAPPTGSGGGVASRKETLQELQQQLAGNNMSAGAGTTKVGKPKKVATSGYGQPMAQKQQPPPAQAYQEIDSLNNNVSSSGEFRSVGIRSRSASPKLTLNNEPVNNVPPVNNNLIQQLQLQVRYAGGQDGGIASIGKPTVSSGRSASVRAAGNNDNKSFGTSGEIKRKVKRKKDETMQSNPSESELRAPAPTPAQPASMPMQANIGSGGVGGAKRNMKMLAGIGGGGGASSVNSSAGMSAALPAEPSLPHISPTAATSIADREVTKSTKAAANIAKQQQRHQQQQQQQQLEDSYRNLVAGYGSSEVYDDQEQQGGLPVINAFSTKPQGGSRSKVAHGKAGERGVVAEPSPPAHVPGKGGLNIASRIRSSINTDDSQWLQGAPMTEEEEEAMLEAEIRNTKKQLRKQEKLKEYKQSKEEKMRQALERELQERQREEEAEKEKDRQRRARAEKQKQKLKQYSEQIKTEAETIKDLIALGIDPSSLVLPTD